MHEANSGDLRFILRFIFGSFRRRFGGIKKGAIVFAIFKGNKSVVMKMLYALVTEAEKNMGGGTGSLKLASVIEAIYPKLPSVIKVFITDAMLKNWVEEVLAIAKEAWEKNSNIAQYIAPVTDPTQPE